MGRCVYCGEPAGFVRTSHRECRERYHAALENIPVFFKKMLYSTLEPSRFAELLSNVASATNVKPDELRQLSEAGINAMIDMALAHHLMTEDEEARVLEIASSFGLEPSASRQLAERLTKIAMLRDFAAGMLPDRVDVSGPMPFEFEPDEGVIWIFNRVTSYRHPRGDGDEESNITMKSARPAVYYPLEENSLSAAPLDQFNADATGDLVLTNKTIFFVAESKQRKFPLSRIATFEPFSNAFSLVRKSDDRPSTFRVDDPWFAVNLVASLLRLVQKLPEESDLVTTIPTP